MASSRSTYSTPVKSGLLRDGSSREGPGSPSSGSASTSYLPPFLRTDPSPVAPPSKARLQALYASTSQQRITNPTGYDVNVRWWAQVIVETVRNGWLGASSSSSSGTATPGRSRTPGKGKGKATSLETEIEEEGWIGGDRLTMRMDDGMLDRLSDSHGVRPKGIGGVVELQSTTSPPNWYPLSTFMSSPTPLHAPSSLTYRLVGKPLWWAFSQLNPFGGSELVEKEEVLWKKYGKGREYVIMSLLQESAALFSDYIEENPSLSYSASLFSVQSFRDHFGSIVFPDNGELGPKHRISIKDTEVLLKWLSRDCGSLVMDDKAIKILADGEKAVDHPITEADRGILNIVLTLKRIDEQIDRIQDQIIACQDKAKAHLSKGQKNLAMSQLKSKKALEELLDKRLGAGDQLRTVIRSIDQAKSDIEIMSAYEIATSTLKTTLAHPSLDREHIDKTTDELAEAMADQQEIDEAIRSGGALATGSAEADEDELAAELQEMVEEEKARQKQEEEEKAKNAPVDASSPEQTGDEKHAEPEKTNSVKQGALKPETTSREEERSEAAMAEWQKRYDDAQDRKREEQQRAGDERRAKEDQRLPAE